MTKQTIGIIGTIAAAAIVASASIASAQVITQRPGVPANIADKLKPPPPPAPVPNYIIGADDVLSIVVWRENDVSGAVKVRPDGKITLPIGNDIVAVGLTIEELKDKVTAELKRFYEEPTVFIQVKEINSRRVFIMGPVNKPGAYPLMGPMTVSQLITVAGSLLEFADKKNIMLIGATLKAKDGTPLAYRINYDDISKGKNLAKYNIELRPGDQVIVR